MNNQWLNDLRKKMEGHTDDVPDGLWDDIKDELFFEGEKKAIVGTAAEESNLHEEKKQIPARKIKPLVYRIAGIAAAIAMFFIIGKQLFREDHKKESAPKISYAPEKSIRKTQENLSESEPSSLSGKEKNNLEADHYVLKKITLDKSTILRGSTFQNSLDKKLSENRSYNNTQEDRELQPLHHLLGQNVSIIESQIPPIDDVTRSINHRNEIDELISETDLGSQNKSIADKTKSKQKSKKSWMLSMLTGKASSESQQFPGYTTMSGQPLSIGEMWTSAYENDPFVGVLLANQNKNVEATLRHKVPLNLGVSLYYNLGKRWGIGTGLNYTKLSSELHSGSQSNFVKSEQTVHYIGIPVQVNYNIIQKGKLTGYVTGGALVEKSVAGNFRTKYVVDNVVSDETTERLPKQPIQVSLNTALGVQLKLVDKIGVYAEPGISYHFKDDSSLNTIYKEKPLNFNIKLGIRILLD